MPQTLELNFSDLNFLVPIVVNEGTLTLVHDNGAATLLFFQTRAGQQDKTSADVVAAVRMVNLEELKDYHKSIGEVIKQHETKEK